MIVYGSGNADGNRHTHDNLPLLLAGGGGGTLSPGRYVKHGSKPATNLFLSMADRLGIEGLARFGDSTEPTRQRVAIAHSAWTTTMSPSRILFAFLCLPAAAVVADEPQVVPLWPNGAPGFESRRDEPELAKDYWVKNIHNPSITVFLPPKEKATGAAVVICPGGGHRELVFNAEGVDAARYLNSIGVAAFALKYRLGREQGSPYSIEKHAREDGMRAMRLVRARAKEWNVDPARLGIMGFSAGGEVASMVAFNPGEGDPKAADPIDQLSSRPDFLVMIYPGPLGIPAVIPPKSPPAFLIVANDDRGASRVIASLFQKYRDARVPVEAHIFARGGHGFNMGNRSKLATFKGWPQRLGGLDGRQRDSQSGQEMSVVDGIPPVARCKELIVRSVKMS